MHALASASSAAAAVAEASVVSDASHSGGDGIGYKYMIYGVSTIATV